MLTEQVRILEQTVEGTLYLNPGHSHKLKMIPALSRKKVIQEAASDPTRGVPESILLEAANTDFETAVRILEVLRDELRNGLSLQMVFDTHKHTEPSVGFSDSERHDFASIQAALRNLPQLVATISKICHLVNGREQLDAEKEAAREARESAIAKREQQVHRTKTRRSPIVQQKDYAAVYRQVLTDIATIQHKLSAFTTELATSPRYTTFLHSVRD